MAELETWMEIVAGEEHHGVRLLLSTIFTFSSSSSDIPHSLYSPS